MKSAQGAARLVAVAAVLLAAAAGSLAGPGPSAEAGVPRGPAAGRSAAAQPASLVTDSGRALRTKAGLPAPAMTAAMLLANAEKQAVARQFVASARRASTSVRKCVRRSCRDMLPAARNLRRTQRAQVAGYFCGPATVAEMLAQMGRTVGQRKAAAELGTTPGGTDWSDAGGYPVPNVLNENQSLNVYVAVGLPWSPTAAQTATYENDLVTDINHNGGVPLAGDAYEVPGGPHLAGHPVDQTIYHWFDIRGYKDSGAVTDYEDSVHGASSIGWAATVPAYSSLPSATIVEILGARGYDW
jgi:Peptidase_C39 like family